jgi:hypothetical protein
MSYDALCSRRLQSPLGLFNRLDSSTFGHQAMQRIQAFKYELMPNGEQQRQMRGFAGSCRHVFNHALAIQKERFERGEKKFG